MGVGPEPGPHRPQSRAGLTCGTGGEGGQGTGPVVRLPWSYTHPHTQCTSMPAPSTCDSSPPGASLPRSAAGAPHSIIDFLPLLTLSPNHLSCPSGHPRRGPLWSAPSLTEQCLCYPSSVLLCAPTHPGTHSPWGRPTSTDRTHKEKRHVYECTNSAQHGAGKFKEHIEQIRSFFRRHY